MTGAKSVLVLGAGHAGGVLVRTLREEGYEGRITLAGDERWLPYERPPLSKGILLGQQSPVDTQLCDAGWYDSAGIDLCLGQPISSIEPGGAALADGTKLRGDAVVLATGARARVPKVRGMDLANVLLLRSIDDALAIREKLRPGCRVVVVGAGLLGLEAAAAARRIGAGVLVVEATEGALRRVLPRSVGDHVVELHRSHGVELRFGVSISAFEGTDLLQRVVLSDGTAVDADLAIVAIGARPNDELGRSAGLAADDGILVDEYCRTSLPGIHAVGDVTRHYNPWAGRRWRLESWQNAQNQARACAHVILGRNQAYGEVPWAWTDQYDSNIQFAGLVGDDAHQIRRDDGSGGFSVLCLHGDVLVGIVGIDRPRDVREARSLIAARRRLHVDQVRDPRRPLRAALVT